MQWKGRQQKMEKSGENVAKEDKWWKEVTMEMASSQCFTLGLVYSSKVFCCDWKKIKIERIKDWCSDSKARQCFVEWIEMLLPLTTSVLHLRAELFIWTTGSEREISRDVWLRLCWGFRSRPKQMLSPGTLCLPLLFVLKRNKW